MSQPAIIDHTRSGQNWVPSDLVNGCPELNWIEVKPWVPSDVIELGVEHPDDLGALVVHHRLELLVPEDLQMEQ